MGPDQELKSNGEQPAHYNSRVLLSQLKLSLKANNPFQANLYLMMAIKDLKPSRTRRSFFSLRGLYEMGTWTNFAPRLASLTVISGSISNPPEVSSSSRIKAVGTSL